MGRNSMTGLAASYSLALVLKTCLIASCLLQLRLLSHPGFTLAEAHANDLRHRIAGGASVVMALIAHTVFFVWLYRMKKRAVELGMHSAEYSPGFSVGCFFVPIINLFGPYQAMQELWRASFDPRGWHQKRGSPLVGLWWALWLLSSIYGILLLYWQPDGSKIEALRKLTTNALVGTGFNMVVITVTLILASRITDQLNEAETTPPSLPEIDNQAATGPA